MATLTFAARRSRSVSGPLDIKALRGTDRQAQRQASLPQIPGGRNSPANTICLSGTEELDNAQHNVILLQNKVSQRREALKQRDALLDGAPASQLTWNTPAPVSRRPRRRTKTSPQKLEKVTTLLPPLDSTDPGATSSQPAVVDPSADPLADQLPALRPQPARRIRADLASLLDKALLGEIGTGEGVHARVAPCRSTARSMAGRSMAGRKDLVQQLCAGNNLERIVELFHRSHHNGFGSGFVDKREFYQMLIGVVGIYDRPEVDSLFGRFDPERSGYISYREFQTAIKREQRETGAAPVVPDAKALVRAGASKMRWRKAAEDFALAPGAGVGGAFKAAVAQAAAAARQGQSVINPTMPSAPLHVMRKRELIGLVKTFDEQQEAGVCRVKSIRQLIKISYPKAPPVEVDTMLDFIKSMKTFEADAIKETKERKREVEDLFLALDTECAGSIELGEFLRLSDNTGVSQERLTELFSAQDVHGSGSLDMQEFVTLIDDCDLLSHRESIIKRGAALKNNATVVPGSRGMPRSKSEGSHVLSATSEAKKPTRFSSLFSVADIAKAGALLGGAPARPSM